MDEKALHAHQLCLTHAESFITAAETLDPAIWPHIVYHLSLLALEEVGKASMLAGRAVSDGRFGEGLIDRSLTSHRRKLQWAVWSPMRRIDPADFERARDFAERAHERRLNSLYVDPDAVPTDPPPAERVLPEDAIRALELARLRWEYGTQEGASLEVDELAEWFMDVAADPLPSRRLFSAPFLAKYEALNGDVRAWAAWAREEFSRGDEEFRALQLREFTRVPSARDQSKPRWRANATVYTPSHSLRPKALAHWNRHMDAVQLQWTGKKDRLNLQITVKDNVPLGELVGRLTSAAKIAVACLNIGTIGYFWFERPGFEQKMFKDIVDLELNLPLEMKRGESFWGDGRAVALTETLVDNALHCVLAFAPLPEDVAEPIFRPYLDGLAFIAKSDIFYDMNEPARQCFTSSLAAALHHFGGWSREQDDFEGAFHRGFASFMPDADHRTQMLKSLTREGDSSATPLENLRSAKQLTDLYLIHTGRRTWQAALEAAAAEDDD